eukprot:scaffold1006_cov270-Pinguiococcus_pyrenoidosus.AAC.14
MSPAKYLAQRVQPQLIFQTGRLAVAVGRGEVLVEQNHANALHHLRRCVREDPHLEDTATGPGGRTSSRGRNAACGTELKRRRLGARTSRRKRRARDISSGANAVNGVEDRSAPESAAFPAESFARNGCCDMG